MRSAYTRWGEDAVARIHGDWAFAAWHPKERRLFLARDPFGITSLYYYANPRIFAFATSRQALVALNLAPVEMDELYLAQVLVVVAWLPRRAHQSMAPFDVSPLRTA